MYRRILVPVAPGGEDRAAQSLNVAGALAAEDARIILLTVVEPIPAYVEGYIPEGIQAENKREMRAALTALAAQSGRNAEAVLITGHAARAVVDYAEAHEVDCIVIASHHPDLADYFTGSNAAWVARHADCSIHVIR